MFLRLVGDALFWTFHPFSPLNYGYYDNRMYGARPVPRKRDETPFYEKVNRFVFGPTMPKPDPLETERMILAEIRAQKGRIGLADVMRVTGLPREEADPKMARLMLDYDGEVLVSEEGGITYTFAELRKSAEESPGVRPPPIWTKPERLPPLTGNDGGANFLVMALNGFNLLMSSVAFSANFTLGRINDMFFTPHPRGIPYIPIPYDGVPIVLGLVPLVFSLLIFALPIGRAIVRPLRARKTAKENGRRQVLREVVTRIERHEEVAEEALAAAWTKGAGSPPDDKELTRIVTLARRRCGPRGQRERRPARRPLPLRRSRDGGLGAGRRTSSRDRRRGAPGAGGVPVGQLKPWPEIGTLAAALALPAEVTLRQWREDELTALPARLLAWYPAVAVGSESIFLERDFLERSITREGHDDRDIYAFCIEQDGAPCGFMSFERQPRSSTLHARLGCLAPEARRGFLGMAGFLLFEKLGALVEAELLLSWVTLSSLHQQRFAERRGFRVVGLVPGFDRDAQPAGGSLRVAEALYARQRTAPSEQLDPAEETMTPAVQAMWRLVRS